MRRHLLGKFQTLDQMEDDFVCMTLPKVFPGRIGKWHERNRQLIGVNPQDPRFNELLDQLFRDWRGGDLLGNASNAKFPIRIRFSEQNLEKDGYMRVDPEDRKKAEIIKPKGSCCRQPRGKEKKPNKGCAVTITLPKSPVSESFLIRPTEQKEHLTFEPEFIRFGRGLSQADDMTKGRFDSDEEFRDENELREVFGMPEAAYNDEPLIRGRSGTWADAPGVLEASSPFFSRDSLGRSSSFRPNLCFGGAKGPSAGHEGRDGHSALYEPKTKSSTEERKHTERGLASISWEELKRYIEQLKELFLSKRDWAERILDKSDLEEFMAASARMGTLDEEQKTVPQQELNALLKSVMDIFEAITFGKFSEQDTLPSNSLRMIEESSNEISISLCLRSFETPLVNLSHESEHSGGWVDTNSFLRDTGSQVEDDGLPCFEEEDEKTLELSLPPNMRDIYNRNKARCLDMTAKSHTVEEIRNMLSEGYAELKILHNYAKGVPESQEKERKTLVNCNRFMFNRIIKALEGLEKRGRLDTRLIDFYKIETEKHQMNAPDWLRDVQLRHIFKSFKHKFLKTVHWPTS